jgi:tRNA G18 (ribose-2'-O)-methylase SpoU
MPETSAEPAAPTSTSPDASSDAPSGVLSGVASDPTNDIAVVTISDLADPRLADYAHQTDVALKKARGTEHGLYLAESLLVFERALRAGHRPRSVLSLGGSVDDALELLRRYDALDTPVFSGPAALLEELTGYVLHRGVIASMHRPALPDPASLLATARRIVVLENVSDPTNVGAIFRSVAAIGADAVLVTPRCSDPFYRRAIRVSMGTVLQVPWTRVGEWASTRDVLVAAGFHIAALALTDDAVDLRGFAATAPDRVALVLGAEGDGLTDEAIAAADTVVQIPMAHGIDSLNVAATAAVAMYALAV